MNILFIHQNFPGQFKFLAPALASKGHQVKALCILKQNKPVQWQGVDVIPYQPKRSSTPNIHPWVTDFETKIIRAEACFRYALALKESGFTPDLIIAHHGWGESLFIKQVWPQAKLGIYCEFFYNLHGSDVGFDAEFQIPETTESCRLYLKNLSNLLHFDLADAAISPTHWQASTFPQTFQQKISVIHDGIDTNIIKPLATASLPINEQLTLTKQDEVITFVNRNLEPYRGYHIFMRALPSLLKQRPNAKVLIVGADDVSYGARAPDGKKWKDIFIEEVRMQISDADWQRVHFLGQIPYQNFISLLQISTVHVYLTYPFVLSWSLLEAMSAGCAIVASDTQPLQELIEHGKTGLLVNFFDAQGFADTISQLLDNPSLRQQLALNARNKVVQEYDLSTICLPKQIAWVEQLAGKS